MIISKDWAGLRPPTAGEVVEFIVGYAELVLARWDAREERLHPYLKPVAWSCLRTLGVGVYPVTWMLYHGHVDHLCPAGAAPPPAGELSPAPGVLPAPASYFVLTERGEAFADPLLAELLVPEGDEFEGAARHLAVRRLAPCFDRAERLLTWGRHTVKEFRQPSLNQVNLLETAEELGWPEWFDDSLPRVHGLNPKVRLHDTIKALNRHQKTSLIHFKGDGTGTRVGWEYR
jgi:hypothetical protein